MLSSLSWSFASASSFLEFTLRLNATLRATLALALGLNTCMTASDRCTLPYIIPSSHSSRTSYVIMLKGSFSLQYSHLAQDTLEVEGAWAYNGSVDLK
jgi:hypothetical protein